jgi:phosphatidylglycerol:prolipoprotein diacylglycerol transferase
MPAELIAEGGVHLSREGFVLARRESIRSKVGTLAGAFLIGYAIARIIGESST